ncbi:hypothetical protein PRZ48_009558, partial [Zasmidium cellare]
MIVLSYLDDYAPANTHLYSPTDAIPGTVEILTHRIAGAVIPIFPLTKPPYCVHCQDRGVRREAHISNPNGNAGRPYWICADDSCPQWVHDQKTWICWDDRRGLAWKNPPCKCGGGLRSRLQTMGYRSKKPGNYFWTCAIGQCAYYSEDVEGLTWEQLDDSGIAVRRFKDPRWPYERGEEVLEPHWLSYHPESLMGWDFKG